MGLSLEQKEARLGELWKVFGMNTAAGKSLYKMFGNKYKKKISYPKPKTKKWSAKEAQKKTLKSTKYGKDCKQNTKIYYPPVTTKADLQRKKMMKNYNKLDFMPKRRGKRAIMEEMEERRKDVYVPKNTGKDRAKMIDDLQDKFKYANDPVNKFKINKEEDQKIKKALKAQVRKEAAKNHFYTFEKETGEDKKNYMKKEEGMTNTKLMELNGLFDAVCEEIEERQNYLKEIDHLEMEDTKSRVKQEIVERVAELQKINKLIKIERAENGA
jgi:hypothetical protein